MQWVQQIYERMVGAGLGLDEELRIADSGASVPIQWLAELLKAVPGCGVPKLHGAWSREVDRRLAECAFASTEDPMQRTQLVSVRNETGGLWPVELRARVQNLGSVHWRIAARMRLGLPVLDTDLELL